MKLHKNQTIYETNGDGDTDVYIASEVDAKIAALEKRIEQLENEIELIKDDLD